MTYDVDYFIKKFEAIPEKLWMTGDWTDGKRCCAGGHCGVYGSPNEEWYSLKSLFEQLRVTLIDRTFINPVAVINDCNTNEYQQPTPKQRILAALHDIKKLNQGTGTSTERRNEVTSELHRADITKKLSQIEIVSETSDLKKELCK